MKLHILIDNLPPQGCLELANEHGLSVYFTLEGKNYLVDTGASGKFMHNMEQLQGVCAPDAVDYVIISHGHNDHTGGLRKFLEENTAAQVYLHNTIQGNYFYSCRPKNGIREARNIGMEQALFIDFPHRFIQLDEPFALSEKVIILPVYGEKKYPTPMGNGFLYKNDFPDDFSHEIATLVEYSPHCWAVISPCTHNGILNVLECCSDYLRNSKGLSGRENIGYFVGGLHYVDYLKIPEKEDAAEKEAASIAETASSILELYPDLKIFSGHCTYQGASELLKKILGNNYCTFYSGSTISFIPNLGTKCTPSLR